jgi:hypothetical protein
MALADGRIVTANADEHEDLSERFAAARAIVSGRCWRSNTACENSGRFEFKWPLKDDSQVAAAVEALTLWQRRFTGDLAPAELGQQALLVRTKRERGCRNSGSPS